MGGKKYATMVIDIQNSFVNPGNPKLTPTNQKEVDNIAAFLKATPETDKYIVTYPDSGASTWENNADKRILDVVKGQDNITFFEKNKPNAFAGGHITKGKNQNLSLHKHLKKNDITDLIIVGLNQDACVLGTIRGAIENGYHITVAKDMIFTASEDDKGPRHQVGFGGKYSAANFYKQQVKKGNLTIVDTAKDIKSIIHKTNALNDDYTKDNKKEYLVLDDDSSLLIPTSHLPLEVDNKMVVLNIPEHASEDNKQASL